MIQIRRNVFETNSSSTHTLVITTESEYSDWIKGTVVYDGYQERLISIEEAMEISGIKDKEEFLRLLNDVESYNDVAYRFHTFDEFYDDDELEFFKQDHITKHGDKVVVFGCYGYC